MGVEMCRFKEKGNPDDSAQDKGDEDTKVEESGEKKSSTEKFGEQCTLEKKAPSKNAIMKDPVKDYVRVRAIPVDIFEQTITK
ncbi:hypothetical protein HAX54_030473, partial [Datura stramonium]|nr:hypothetical protein [Datura stramonium]